MLSHGIFSSYFILKFSIARLATIYDAGIYTEIAKSGYPPTVEPAYSMFPMYPLLIRILGSFIGYHLAAVILVITLSSLSTVFFYRICLQKSKYPLQLSFLFIFFPYAWMIVSSLPYSEPLFILFCLMTFYYMMNGKVYPASVVASLATLTRTAGILLIIPLFYSVYKSRKMRDAPIVFLPLIGLVLLFTFHWYLTGDFFAHIHAQRAMGSDLPDGGTFLVYPFYFIAYFIQKGLTHLSYWRIIVMFAIYTIGILGIRKDKLLLIYSLPFYVLNISLSQFPTFWFGLDRQLLPVFPFIFTYEKLLCERGLWNRLLFIAVIIVSLYEAFRFLNRWCLLAP